MLQCPWPARGPRLTGLLAALAALSAPATALATSDLVVDGPVTLGADAPAYKTFTVKSTGTVTVKPYKSGSTTDTGWVTILANTIIVEKGGQILADGAGYPGQDGKAGVCQLVVMPATACAGSGTVAGLPGGGGGFFGKGANGALEMTAGTCTDLAANAAGGLAFMDPKKLDLGSAGGAGQLSNPALTAGGAGGGGIRLIAATITLDGTLSANGATRSGLGGVGPGGGSGGAIEISAAKLTGTGTLSVKGGDGAHGAGIPGTFPPNNGGGGSGGVVLLHLPPGVTSPLTVTADGGKTGDCNNFPGATGGAVADPLTDTCLDADGDTHKSKDCGGDDCDDSDPGIFPGAPEICNGVSESCGPVDAPPNNCTAMGLVCGMSGGAPACVAPLADGGTDAGGELQYIQYGGGCELGLAMGEPPSPAAEPRARPTRGLPEVGLLIAALALGARRRRR